MPALPVMTPNRSLTHSSASPATRSRTRCWSTSPTPWTVTAGYGWRTTRSEAWSCGPSTVRCSPRSSGPRRSRRCWASGWMRTPSRCTRPSGDGSSRRCSRSAGRRRTSPVMSTARRTRSNCARTAGSCASIRRARWRGSGRVARAWWCCPAAPARPSSVPRPWPTPVPPRSSWSPTRWPAGSGARSC